ncbi:LysR family transcriptional regulator [Roseibium limicola]|uniref:LysR family transcriptional regulator n=1 Tax=Roseibium limicola TaxID=2816037 RepID=A0A939ERP7_9HYPH|nr:LysR substrate-binding domain-containing protein [Roseibium limicola]MBO0347444.1 LysR family transcriptional regulator [Roseibium limicola]
MDIRQLETLLAIAQHGGFAAAARGLNMTASAVSQQIASLEAEIGADLFDRSRRPPVLTTRGAEVLAAARRILRIVTETKSSISGSEVRGTLVLGTLRTGGSFLVPRALASLRGIYPELTYRLRIGMSEELMAEVASGQLDAALVADHVAVPAGLQWTSVISEPLVVLTPPGVSGDSLEDLLLEVPYIRYRTRVPLARQIDTEIARLGVSPREIISVNTMTAVIGCVEAGLGFAIIPYVALQHSLMADLRWFPFGSPPLRRQLGVVQRRDTGRVDILDTLTEALRQAGSGPDDID